MRSLNRPGNAAYRDTTVKHCPDDKIQVRGGHGEGYCDGRAAGAKASLGRRWVNEHSMDRDRGGRPAGHRQVGHMIWGWE
jgi:hypothetical protein